MFLFPCCLKVSYLAGNLHDAVMLYALTADSMIKQGMDPRDGRLFTQHARTIKFEGRIAISPLLILLIFLNTGTVLKGKPQITTGIEMHFCKSIEVIS